MADEPNPYSFQQQARKKRRQDAAEKQIRKLEDLLRRHPDGNFIAGKLVDAIKKNGPHVDIKEFKRALAAAMEESIEHLKKGQLSPPRPPRRPAS